MPPKREQVLWKGVWQIARDFERAYGLKGMLSGAVLAFTKVPADERENYVTEANRLTEQDEDKAAAQEIVVAAEAHEVEPHRKKGGKSAKSA